MKPRPPEPRPPTLESQTNEKAKEEGQEVLGYVLHKNAIRDWLLTFQQCVRDSDLESVKSLLCFGVVAFGLKVRRTEHLGQFSEEWMRMWEKTSGFAFNFDEMNFFHDKHSAHIALTWNCCERKFGAKLRRQGRASFYLIGNDGQIKCAASHFSLDP